MWMRWVWLGHIHKCVPHSSTLGSSMQTAGPAGPWFALDPNVSEWGTHLWMRPRQTHRILSFTSIFEMIWLLNMKYNFTFKNQIIKRRGNLKTHEDADLKMAATRQCYVLVIICMTFLFCHIIRIFLAIHEVFVVDQYRQGVHSFWYEIYINISNLTYCAVTKNEYHAVTGPVLWLPT